MELFSLLIHHLQGHTSISIQWGAWAGAGMAGNDYQTRLRVERTGLGLLPADAGLGTLEGLLRTLHSVPALAAAVPIQWAKFLEKQFGGRAPPMFMSFAHAALPAQMPPAGHIKAAGDFDANAAQRAGAAVLPTADRQAYLLEQVQETVRAVLGGDVGSDQPLMAAGLDSLSSVEFRNSLESKLGVDLPTTLVFDYPTVAAVVEYLVQKVQPEADEADVSAALGSEHSSLAGYHGDAELAFTSATPEQHQQQLLIAVQGMVVRAGANAFSSLQPVDAVGLVPADRWDLDSRQELFGGLPLRFGTFLKGIAMFDAHAVGVSEGEVTLMDPQQRILLEMVAELLLEGSRADAAGRQTTGAFVGLSSTDYAKVRL